MSFFVTQPGLLHPHIPPGLRLQALDTSGLNSSSQLVIGYRWIEFLNQVREESMTQSSNSQLTVTLITKETISQIEKHKIFKLRSEFVSEHSASQNQLFIPEDFKNLERPYLKN